MYVARTGATTDEVVIGLSYGTGIELGFSPVNVTLAVGVSIVSVAITGLAPHAFATIQTTVISGAVFFNPLILANVEVLPLVPLALEFDVASQPIFVSRFINLNLVVNASRTSRMGSTTVTFSYNGAAIELPTPVVISRDAEVVQYTVQLTGITVFAAHTLSIALTGAGSSSYSVARSSWEVPVLEQSFVGVLSSPDTVLVGQTSIVSFGLMTLPRNPNGIVTLELRSSPLISFSVPTLSLSADAAEANVTFTGLAGGRASVWSLVNVMSTNGQYEHRILNNPTIVVLTMGTVVASHFPALMYQGESTTIAIELSQAPQLPGTSLVVTPTSAGGIFTPATITYTGSTIHQTVVFTASTVGSTTVSFSLDGTAASTYTTAPTQQLLIANKIPVVLFFTADASEIGVTETKTLSVGIDASLTSVTGDMIVSFTYGTGNELNFSGPVIFPANSSQTSGSFSLTGLSAMANGTLTMSFSGPGAASYYATTYSWTVTVKSLPFGNCSNVLAIPFNSGSYKNADCALCARGANSNLPQCATVSQCYCAGTTPSCQYQFAFLGCTTITNMTTAYSAADCMTCVTGSCNPACLADACKCTTVNFGNNNALDALAAATGTTDPAINGAVIAFAIIAGIAVIGGGAFFIVRHLRSAAAAAQAATAAKSNPASGGESGVLPPMQPYFSVAQNPLGDVE